MTEERKKLEVFGTAEAILNDNRRIMDKLEKELAEVAEEEDEKKENKCFVIDFCSGYVKL